MNLFSNYFPDLAYSKTVTIEDILKYHEGIIDPDKRDSVESFAPVTTLNYFVIMIAIPNEKDFRDYSVLVFNEYLEYDHQFSLSHVKHNPSFSLQSIASSNLVYFYCGFDETLGNSNAAYQNVLIDLSTKKTSHFPYHGYTDGFSYYKRKIHHYMGRLFTSNPGKTSSLSGYKFLIRMNSMNDYNWHMFDCKEDAELFGINISLKIFIIGIYGDIMYLCVMDVKTTIISMDLNKMKILAKFIIEEKVYSSNQIQIVDKYCVIRKYLTVFPASEMFCVYELENWNQIALLKLNKQIYDSEDFQPVDLFGISCSLIGTTLHILDLQYNCCDAFDTTSFGKETSSEVHDPVMESDKFLLVSFTSSCVFFSTSGILIRTFAKYDNIFALYTVKEIKRVCNHFQDCIFQYV